MWLFDRSKGAMYRSGYKVGPSYSGNGDGLNNPAMESVHDVGPIPAGFYTIGPYQEYHPELGEFVAPLIPDEGNEMYGRADFYNHGDNTQMNYSASKGCIVSPRWVRNIIADSQDNRMQVK